MNERAFSAIRNALLMAVLMLAAPLLWASDPATALGAVIDTRAPDPAGLRVMAVTPNGTAETIGVQPGDRLTGVNGVDVASADRPSEALHAALSNGQALQLSLVRQGRPITLSGQLAAPTAGGPAATGCGYVSSGGPVPRVSENIHDVEITQINGRSTPLRRVNRHRLPAGKHVLVVRELIDSTRFTNVQLRHRALESRRQQGGFYTTLLVDVAPNTRYWVGARLVKGRGEATREDFADKSYWEPVVWRETPERCD